MCDWNEKTLSDEPLPGFCNSKVYLISPGLRVGVCNARQVRVMPKFPVEIAGVELFPTVAGPFSQEKKHFGAKHLRLHRQQCIYVRNYLSQFAHVGILARLAVEGEGRLICRAARKRHRTRLQISTHMSACWNLSARSMSALSICRQTRIATSGKRVCQD
jgi:hypothetical protein